MSNNSNDSVVIKHNSKEYEIKKTKDEQKVIPKGEVAPTSGKHPNEIIVKDYEEKFWNTSANIDGNKVEIKWGGGKYITFIGLPAVLVVVGLTIAYFWYKGKDKSEEGKDNL